VADTTDPNRLVISYQTLHHAANDIDNLDPIATELSNNFKGQDRSDIFAVPGLNNYDNPDMGDSTYAAMMNFYSDWAFKMSDAMNGLKSLGALFRSVGNAFAETDMSMAGSINLAQLTSQILDFPQRMDAYVAALNYKGTENPYTHQFPDMPDPVMPTQPDSPFTLMPGTNLSTSWLYRPEADANVPPGQKSSTWVNRVLATETTTDTVDGMTYSETTTYSIDKGWGPNGPTQDTTQVVTHIDGSHDTITTTVDPATGNATQVDTPDSGTVVTSDRTGWNGTFVDRPPPDPPPPDYVPPEP